MFDLEKFTLPTSNSRNTGSRQRLSNNCGERGSRVNCRAWMKDGQVPTNVRILTVRISHPKIQMQNLIRSATNTWNME